MCRFLLAAAILTILITGSAAAQIERNLGSRGGAPLRPRQGERPRPPLPPQPPQPQSPTAAQVVAARSIAVSCRGGARHVADRMALPVPPAPPIPTEAAAPPAPSAQNVAEAPEAQGPEKKAAAAEAPAKPESRLSPLDAMAEANRREREKPAQTTAPEPPAKTKAEGGKAAPDAHAAGAHEAAQAPAGESASGGGESAKGAAAGGEGAGSASSPAGSSSEAGSSGKASSKSGVSGGGSTGQAPPAAEPAPPAKEAGAAPAAGEEKPAKGSAEQAGEPKPAAPAHEVSAPENAPAAEGTAAEETKAPPSESAARPASSAAEEPPAEGRHGRRPNLIVTKRKGESQTEEKPQEVPADSSLGHENAAAPAPAPGKGEAQAAEPPESTPAQAPPAASHEGPAADNGAKEAGEAPAAGAEDARTTLGWSRTHPPGQESPPAEPAPGELAPKHRFDLPDTTLAQLDAGTAATPKAEADVFAALPAPSAAEPLVLSMMESPSRGSAPGAGAPDLLTTEMLLPNYGQPAPRVELPHGLVEFSRGNHKRKQVALTFDDGPHPPYTSQLLAVLSFYHVPATFFVVGIQVQKYPQWVMMIHQAGHEVGSHTYDHFRITKLSPSEKAYQVDELQSLVGNLIGVKPRFLRPPGGHMDAETAKFVASRGLVVALWDVTLNDVASGRTSRGLLKSALAKVRPGSVILAHDGVQSTIDMLPELITELRAEGYEFVTMSELAAGL